VIAFERAYINTRHEDFVGFSYAEQKAYSRVLKRRNPGADITMRGWLRVNSDKRYWFVLTLDALTWYAGRPKPTLTAS
jgi:dynamin GTPase